MIEKRLWRLALLCAAAGFLSTSPDASGYILWTLEDTPGGTRVQWRAGSPTPPWNDATKTLTWRLNTRNFPAGTLPSIDQAGAALANGFRSIQDIVGASIRFQRGTNTNASPAAGDAQFHVYFHTSTSLDPFGGDISGAYAVTYPNFSAGNGTVVDMDIFFNAAPGAFTWRTDAPNPPAGSVDIEVTHIHEALHAIGILHPTYFYAAVWPTGRAPELALFDRCYSPDDRAAVRLLYPEAPLLGTLTGSVQVGATPAAFAIVVATDGNGIPQATTYTVGNGSYSLMVPPGTYTLNAHHLINSPTDADVPVVSPTPFFSATPVAGVNVASGGTTPAAAIVCSPGTPSMTLERIGTPGNLQRQVQFLPPGSNGTLRLEISADSSFTDVSAVDLGLGINVTLGTVSMVNPTTTTVDITYAVDPNATPGVRNVTVTRATGERLFLPAYHEVLGTGSLSVAAGPANPSSSALPTSAVNHPALQVRLTAGATEDVRVRRLAFDITGSGPALPNVRLYRDVNSNGLVDGGDERVLTSAAYGLPIPSDQTIAASSPGQAVFDLIDVSVLAGSSVDLLLAFDSPAAGPGTYAASLAAAGFSNQAHGMFYGDVLSPSGGATGGTLTIGNLSLGSLGQFESPAGTAAIPVGGSTTQTAVILRGTVTVNQGQAGLEFELRPLGTPFNGTATHSSPTTFASGSVISVSAGGLSNATSYHWQARPVSSSLGAGAWMSFGGNAESAPDFSADSSTTTLGGPLEQLDAALSPLAIGAASRGSVHFRAPVSNSAMAPVSLQVEIVPAGLPFTGVPTVSSAFVPSGTVATASFSAASGDFRWQARAVGQFGSASAWGDFGVNGLAIDFHLDVAESVSADGGCVGRASPLPSATLALLALAVAVVAARRRARAWIFLLLMALPAAASEETLPTTLGAPPVRRTSMSLDASLGLLFLDSSFEATGTDGGERELDGLGSVALGAAALFNVGEDWRLGLSAEFTAGGDLLSYGVGPLLAWRIAKGRTLSDGQPEVEHWLYAGAQFSALEVTKSGFGDFKAAFAPRAGYELRLNTQARFGWRVGAELRFARYEYDESILDGDDELGGAAALVFVGVAWTP